MRRDMRFGHALISTQVCTRTHVCAHVYTHLHTHVYRYALAALAVGDAVVVPVRFYTHDLHTRLHTHVCTHAYTPVCTHA